MVERFSGFKYPCNTMHFHCPSLENEFALLVNFYDSLERINNNNYCLSMLIQMELVDRWVCMQRFQVHAINLPEDIRG